MWVMDTFIEMTIGRMGKKLERLIIKIFSCIIFGILVENGLICKVHMDLKKTLQLFPIDQSSIRRMCLLRLRFDLVTLSRPSMISSYNKNFELFIEALKLICQPVAVVTLIRLFRDGRRLKNTSSLQLIAPIRNNWPLQSDVSELLNFQQSCYILFLLHHF